MVVLVVVKDEDEVELELVVVVAADWTLSVELPELGPLLESPGYDALMVTLPAVVPETIIEQVPAELSPHEAGEGKVTAPTLAAACENVIGVPVPPPLVPVTVAVQVDAAPTAIEAGTQLKAVLVEASAGSTVRVEVPTLGELLGSPGYDALIVTSPAVAPVTLIEHDSFGKAISTTARLQFVCDGSVTAPEPPGCNEKVIISPTIVSAAPLTVAVQADIAAIATGEEHETLVVVDVSWVVYWKVVVIVAVPPGPPQVAFTTYIPTTQLGDPPATVVPL